MHGQKETSILPRVTWTIVHVFIVALVGWIFFGGGIEAIGSWFGKAWQAGDNLRRIILMGFSIVLFIRMVVTAFVFLKRKFGWSECVSVIGAVAVYQLGFSVLGATTTEPVTLFDYIAIAVFLIGSFLNSASELQRKKFKEKQENKGRLYTQGIFSLVRHPNYLGDSLWVTAWAMMTRDWWSAIIAIACITGFVFAFIPQLSTYLAIRYGEQYEKWTKTTKKLIPYIY